MASSSPIVVHEKISDLSPSGSHSLNAYLVDGNGVEHHQELDPLAKLDYDEKISSLSENFDYFASRDFPLTAAPAGKGLRISVAKGSTVPNFGDVRTDQQNDTIRNSKPLDRTNIIIFQAIYKELQKIETEGNYELSSISSQLTYIDTKIHEVKIGSEKINLDAYPAAEAIERARIEGDIDDVQYIEEMQHHIASLKQKCVEIVAEIPLIKALKEPDQRTGLVPAMTSMRARTDTSDFFGVNIGINTQEANDIAAAKNIPVEQVYENFHKIVTEWAKTYDCENGTVGKRSCVVSNVQFNGCPDTPHIYVESAAFARYTDPLTGLVGYEGVSKNNLNYDIQNRLAVMLKQELGIAAITPGDTRLVIQDSHDTNNQEQTPPKTYTKETQALKDTDLPLDGRPSERRNLFLSLPGQKLVDVHEKELAAEERELAEIKAKFDNELAERTAKLKAKVEALQETKFIRDMSAEAREFQAEKQEYERMKPTIDAAISAVKTLKEHEVFADKSPDELLAELPEVTIKAIEDAAEATEARERIATELTEANDLLNATNIAPEAKEALLNADNINDKITIISTSYQDLSERVTAFDQVYDDVESSLRAVAQDVVAFDNAETIADKVEYIIGEKDDVIAFKDAELKTKDAELKTAHTQVVAATTAMHDMQQQFAEVQSKMAEIEKEAALLRARLEIDNKAQSELVEKLPAMSEKLGLTRNDMVAVENAVKISPLDGFDTFVGFAEMAAERRNNDFESVKGALNDIGKDFGYQYDEGRKASVNASLFKEAVAEPLSEVEQLRAELAEEKAKQATMTQHLRELRDGLQNTFGEQLAAVGLKAADVVKDPKVLGSVQATTAPAQDERPWEKAAQTPIKKQETPRRGDEPTPEDENGPKM